MGKQKQMSLNRTDLNKQLRIFDPFLLLIPVSAYRTQTHQKDSPTA